MLFGVEFYITMSYSIFSCLLYILVGYLIIKNKRVFNGSYYNIILVESAVNVFTFLTSAISFHLPRATNKDSSFVDILPKIPFLNFFGCMLCHLPYVQCLMGLALVFNRFTAIIFHLKYKQIWQYLFIPFMLFNIFFPFIFTYPWFIVAVSFAYNQLRDTHMLVSKPDQYEPLSWCLSVASTVVTSISTILMLSTIFFYKYKAKVRDQQVEVGLLIFSVISFLVQLIGTFVTLTQQLQYVDPMWKTNTLKTIGQLVLPYSRDCTTFCSPYILLLCSRRLRRFLKEIFFGTSRKRSVVTPMYGRRTT